MQGKEKDPNAVALGAKGGANSRKNMPPERATDLARKAAAARNYKKGKGEVKK